MALTLLVAITLAFRGAVVGTLLGDVVAVQIRGVDYVAVAATVTLGVLAVADVAGAEHHASGPRNWPRSARSAGPSRRCTAWSITEGALTGAGRLGGRRRCSA